MDSIEDSEEEHDDVRSLPGERRKKSDKKNITVEGASEDDEDDSDDSHDMNNDDSDDDSDADSN
jgi:hypothetical protein